MTVHPLTGFPCHDEFLIFVPDSKRPPVITSNPEAVIRAMEEMGKYARVRRITEGELSRDVTDSFRDESFRDEEGDKPDA